MGKAELLKKFTRIPQFIISIFMYHIPLAGIYTLNYDKFYFETRGCNGRYGNKL